jgi:cytochrome c oxidase cbb3-type subunit 3
MTDVSGQGPAEIDQDRLLDHAYDGIQEYDNPLPRWWVLIFWATIVLVPLYITYYHFGPGELKIERFDRAMVEFYDRQAQELLALGEINDAMLAELQSNESMMGGARKVFQSKCASCHGMFGEGGIGPNMTDEYYLHGGRLTDIYTTVAEGVPTKGMLPWQGKLKPAELLAVSAYVGTLVGTDPPNPKAPQGELYEPEAAAAADPGEPETPEVES